MEYTDYFLSGARKDIMQRKIRCSKQQRATEAEKKGRINHGETLTGCLECRPCSSSSYHDCPNESDFCYESSENKMRKKSVIGNENEVSERATWSDVTDLNELNNFLTLNDPFGRLSHLFRSLEISFLGAYLLYVAEETLNEYGSEILSVKRELGKCLELVLFCRKVASGRYHHGRIDLSYQSFFQEVNGNEMECVNVSDLCHYDHDQLGVNESGNEWVVLTIQL